MLGLDIPTKLLKTKNVAIGQGCLYKFMLDTKLTFDPPPKCDLDLEIRGL